MCAGLPTLEVPERRAADPGRRRPGRASPLLGARRDLVLLLRWYDLPGAQEVDAGASAAADSDSAYCVLDVDAGCAHVAVFMRANANASAKSVHRANLRVQADGMGWAGSLMHATVFVCLFVCLFACCILLHVAC